MDNVETKGWALLLLNAFVITIAFFIDTPDVSLWLFPAIFISCLFIAMFLFPVLVVELVLLECLVCLFAKLR
jgi:hypothetical protein